MKKTVTGIQVVMTIPKSVPAFIVRANQLEQAVAAASVWFPTPNPPLSQLTADITALAAAETAAKTRATGTVAARNDKVNVVLTELHTLKAFVQQVVNAHPDQAALIAEAAAMTLRKSKTAHKSDLAVSKHTVSGSVHVVAKAVKGARSHDWELSTDGGKTWTAAPSTTKSNTVISGLQVGATVSFRQRALTKAGPTDWSQPISAVVS